MINTNTLLEFDEIKSRITKNGRFYYVNNTSYPSVTTVLGKTIDKSYLEEWKKKIGEEEANKISGSARTRGKSIHSMIESYLLKGKIESGQMPINIETFQKLKPHLDKNISNVYGIEAPLYSDRLRIAGRTDLICDWNNELSIVDYKTSRWPKEADQISDYFIQSTIYSMMLLERKGLTAKQIVILMSVENDDPLVFTKPTGHYIKEARDLIRKYHSEYTDV